MKRLLFALFLSVALISLANLIVFSDVPESIRKEQRAEVERAAIPINSINFSDTSYTDLRNLDSILRDNRVLMLGESTHQDGSTFKAKGDLSAIYMKIWAIGLCFTRRGSTICG